MDKIRKVPVQMLTKVKKDRTGKAWRQAFKCSGIRHCEYAHEDVLSPRRAYDRVKIEDINKLRLQSSRPSYSISVQERIKTTTESWYHGFMDFWNKHSARCFYPVTRTRVCQNQSPEMFDRNGVSICRTYVEAMLTLCR